LKQLALREVSVRFGKVEALTKVDLELRSEEVLILVGPNGAGKSTLLKVLLGLVRPDGGRLEIDGKPRVTDAEFKRSIGYLPEAVGFADNLSGRQVLRFFAHARGVSRSRVNAVLERVGLTAAAGRAVRGYSRGMRQRLGLGIAILASPELLILDEPTGGLDQEGLAVLWSLLTEWRDAGRIVLMATHDLALIEQRVDTMCVLQAGRVLASAPPGELRELAGLPVRVDFKLTAEAKHADAFVECVRSWEASERVTRSGDLLEVSVGPDDLLQLIDLRSSHPDAVTGLRVVEPGLDVVYDHLLERDE